MSTEYMKEIKTGELLDKNDMWNAIMANLNQAYSNPNNNYEDLCLIFEASFGFSADKNVKFLPDKDKFEVFEDQNYN